MLRFARHKVTADEAVDVSESNGVRALHLGSVTIQSAMRIKDPFCLGADLHPCHDVFSSIWQ
jgi:spermidine synthase